MNIWTEQLLRQRLPRLQRWLNRTKGKLTLNGLPEKAETLSEWLVLRAQADYLISVYEAPYNQLKYNDEWREKTWKKRKQFSTCSR